MHIGIPSGILAEFCPSGVHEIQQLEGGQVNTTYRVIDALGDISVMQQMAPSSLPKATEDFAIASDHLRAKGWEIAEPVRGISNSLTPVDVFGKPWRSYRYIESDQAQPPHSQAGFRQFAGLLGKLHTDLAELDYEPKATIPHFHDFSHHQAQLTRRLLLLDNKDQDMAEMILDEMQRLPDIPGAPQLIHGDPKLTNGLYRNGEVFTFIDWDTLMRGSPMLDVADMLRSMTGILRDTNPAMNKDALLPIVLGYYAQARPDVDVDTYFDQAVQATRLMALGLAARYLTDIVDGSYFQWDPDRFPDNASHNRYRAERQVANFAAL